jgi:hypothetical protein
VRRLILDWSRSASRRAAGAPVSKLRLAALLVSVLSQPAWGADGDASDARQFLMISDLHFDPMADAKLVDRLAVAEFDRWQTILESSPDKSPSGYGQDSNWALLRSAPSSTTRLIISPTSRRQLPPEGHRRHGKRNTPSPKHGTCRGSIPRVLPGST